VVDFTYYPTSNRVPGVYVEMDNSQANTDSQPQQRTLLIGQRTVGGFYVNAPFLVTNVAQINSICGRGSVLGMMAQRYLERDPFGTLYVLPIDDAPGSVPWQRTITVSGTATAAGTISLYVAGVLLPIGVNVGETAVTVGARIISAIDGNPDLPVFAANPPPAIAIHSKNKGFVANDIIINVNLLGPNAGEYNVPGITLTFGAITPGQGISDITPGLAGLSSEPFDFIGLAYPDANSLAKMKNFMADNTGRWSWMQMVYGHVWAAFRATVGQATAQGLAHNDQHLTLIPFFNGPEPMWIWGAEMLAAAAVSLRNDPAMPLQYIGTTLMPPPITSRYMINERNTLLYDGLSTWRVAADNTVMLERMTTTYQKNGAGYPDNSYLDVETMYGLMYVARDLAAYLSQRYSRKKLVSDQTPIVFGSNTVSAAMIKASIIVEYRALQSAGYVQNAQNFARGVVVENAGNGLVKVLAPVDLANQLRQIALLLQFRKS
jgi:phage tail sheath gpL-like